MTLLRMLLLLPLASSLAAPAAVTPPPVMLPPARVNDPVGVGAASVRARVAPALFSAPVMLTVPEVWLTAPIWAVVNDPARFRMPPETTNVPWLVNPPLRLTVPPVGATTWPPGRLVRGREIVTVLPAALAETVPPFWNAPLPWLDVIFRVPLVAPAAKPTVPRLARTVAAVAASRLTPRVLETAAVPTVTEEVGPMVTVLPPSAKMLATLPPSVRATPVSAAGWWNTRVDARQRVWPPAGRAVVPSSRTNELACDRSSTPADPSMTLLRMLLLLPLASSLAAPAAVTPPPVMLPPARVNDPVGVGAASVRARVAPALFS